MTRRVYTTCTSNDDVDFEVRGLYRKGWRSSSYYEPDEPDEVEDVEGRPEGSTTWLSLDELDLNEEEVFEALLEAGRNPE